MNDSNLSKNYDIGLLLLRIGVGLNFLIPGWGKINGLISHLFTDDTWGFIGNVDSLGFPFPLFFAAVVAITEFVGSLMVLLGFRQKYVLPFLMIIMLVAIFMVKWSQGFSAYNIDFILLLNLIVLYTIGSGSYSVDAKMGGSGGSD